MSGLKNLEHLSVTANGTISLYFQLNDHLQSCVNLRKLKFEVNQFNSNAYDFCHGENFKNFPNLETLDLPNLSITSANDYQPLKHLSNLKCLKLGRVESLKFLEEMPNLIVLELKSIGQIEDILIHDKLEVLRIRAGLYYCNWLKFFKNLKEFELSSLLLKYDSFILSAFKSEYFPLIASLTKLEHLKLSFGCKDTYVIKSKQFFEELNKLLNLKSLVLFIKCSCSYYIFCVNIKINDFHALEKLTGLQLTGFRFIKYDRLKSAFLFKKMANI